MKLILSFLFSASFVICSSQPKGTGEKLTRIETDTLLSVSPSLQRDFDQLQRVFNEINAPDYLKKQNQLISDKYATMVDALVKQMIDPGRVIQDSTRYVNGKIRVILKPKK